jgi:hypothetical protein
MKLPAWKTTTQLSFALITEQQESTFPKEWVNVGVTFGDPRRNCSGSGICKIMEAGQLKHPNCQGTQVNGFLSLVDNRHLKVIFDNRLLDLQTKKSHFANTVMLVRSDLTLPLEITRALGISEKAVISPGRYLIHKEGCYFYHYFRFKNFSEELDF